MIIYKFRCMYKLFYHPICPLSRQARIYLHELKLNFSLIKENYWTYNKELLSVNATRIFPVLLNEDSQINVIGIYPLIEYLIEVYKNFYFMPQEIQFRNDVRKYLIWFNDKFYREVSKILINEKVIKLLNKNTSPKSTAIKIAKNNLNKHFQFLTYCLKQNMYIAYDKLSCADIAAVANISIVDYFGEINWDKWLQIKNWYSIIKSRPSFRPILNDRIAGFVPSKEYSDLDF